METENNCHNCDIPMTGNFCSNCGQKQYQRIDGQYIWTEIQETILHTNKGFLYSIFEIIKNPGKTAREFLDGKRVKHYKPLMLAFVLSGINAFISLRILGLMDKLRVYYSATPNMNSEFMNDYLSFFSSYNSLIMLLLLPIFAVFTKIAFKKWGQNYYEHIVMNSYILSYFTIFSIIVVFPIIFIYKIDPENIVLVSSLQMLIMPFILIWFYKGFYPNRPFRNIIWKVCISMILILLGYIAIIIVGIIIGFVIAYAQGPEAMEYFKPQ
ncbi:DUF3667 domain-containing protein [Belliella marina]|uniref:DUF3667 domain-containing protein n=1 Tax=Belliella marina TaxID=1644146 RepID=A0ABW4VW79_9BACT